jgi:hypothetical protein
MSTKSISTADGKLFFSNPPHPDSNYKPEYKSHTDLKDFKIESTDALARKAPSSVPKVAIYTVDPDVVVTASNPLVISGSGPVSVSFGTVTIETGGQIQVLTTADIKIKELIKK